MGSQSIEADVNEILFCYYLVDKSWNLFGNKDESQKELTVKKEKLKLDKIQDLEQRSKEMAKVVKNWMDENKCPKITKVWWLKATNETKYNELVPDHIWQKYPADIIIETNACKFGVSAKSSNSKNAKPPVKNPGLGTVLITLGIKIDFDSKAKEQLKKKFPGIKFDKQWLRDPQNSRIRKETIQTGKQVRLEICNSMYDELKKKEQNGTLLDYILEEWFDIPRTPRYIKAWGYGQGKRFGAKIIDPLDTKKILEKMVLTVEKSGFSVIVKGKGKKLMGFRSKYESEQMASGLKFSVDISATIDFI